MAFPFETDDEISVEENIAVPKEYEIDYATGELTGNIVEGADAIKVWIYNTLATSRYRHNIYTWDYGNELEDLIGGSYTQEYLEIEVKRVIMDSLLINENITSISDITVATENDKLNISFTANTLFGEVEVDV